MISPSANSAFKPFTSGHKYKVISILFRSLGPGIILTIILFSSLKRINHGKFKIAKYKTPTP